MLLLVLKNELILLSEHFALFSDESQPGNTVAVRPLRIATPNEHAMCELASVADLFLDMAGMIHFCALLLISVFF